eukprot:gene18732-25263_t
MSHKSSDGGGLISQRTSDQGGTVADVSMRGVSRRLDRASANALRGEHQEDSTNGNQAPIKLNDGESGGQGGQLGPGRWSEQTREPGA